MIALIIRLYIYKLIAKSIDLIMAHFGEVNKMYNAIILDSKKVKLLRIGLAATSRSFCHCIINYRRQFVLA